MQLKQKEERVSQIIIAKALYHVFAEHSQAITSIITEGAEVKKLLPQLKITSLKLFDFFL